jgi:hypothetical protein
MDDAKRSVLPRVPLARHAIGRRGPCFGVLAAAPDTKHALDELSEEHERLDVALDRLAAIDLTDADGASTSDRPAEATTQGGGHGRESTCSPRPDTAYDAITDDLTVGAPTSPRQEARWSPACLR